MDLDLPREVLADKSNVFHGVGEDTVSMVAEVLVPLGLRWIFAHVKEDDGITRCDGGVEYASWGGLWEDAVSWPLPSRREGTVTHEALW